MISETENYIPQGQACCTCVSMSILLVVVVSSELPSRIPFSTENSTEIVEAVSVAEILGHIECFCCLNRKL